MAELTINQLIKIIIGILVFVIVILGVSYFFKNYVVGFFTGGKATDFILGII